MPRPDSGSPWALIIYGVQDDPVFTTVGVSVPLEIDRAVRDALERHAVITEKIYERSQSRPTGS